MMNQAAIATGSNSCGGSACCQGASKGTPASALQPSAKTGNSVAPSTCCTTQTKGRPRPPSIDTCCSTSHKHKDMIPETHCDSPHSLQAPISAQPSRGYTLDSPTHTHTPSSSAPSSPTYPPTPMTGLSASTVPLLPSVASAKPAPTHPSLPARCYAAMRNGAKRLFGHNHSHGHDKHSHGHGSCGHDHHHGYGLVSTEAKDEHHHSHGHSHAHHHHHHAPDHPHDCDHEHDDVEVFADPKDGDHLHLPGRYRVTLAVLGMDCPSCSPRVVRALNSLPSVAECHVDVFAGRATVTYHPDHVDTTEMTQHVTASTGFKCQIVQDGPVGESSGPTRRMRIQLDSPMEEKDPEIRGVRIVQEEQPDLIEVEYEAGLNPREVLAGFRPWGGVYVPPAQESSIDSAQREVLRLLHLTTVSAILCFPVLVFAWAPLPPHPTVYGGISLALTTVIQLYVARPIYVSGIRALTVQRTIDMDLLVALSTGTAYLFSTVAYAFREAGRPIDHQGESYFETSALLVTLVMLGRLIAAYARRRSTNAVAQLTCMQVDQATLVLPSGESQVIPTGLVHINDVLRLEPGDRIPTDGRVISGEAHVDESSITGESAPVLKRSGAVLVAGTVLMGSNPSGLDMRVTLSPDENTLSRMAELMRAAQGARLRVQDTADRVAGWLAPVVLVLGTITFVVWAGVGLSAANQVVDATARAAETREAVVDSIGYAVAVLVVSCPCAIALCVPMVAVIAVAVGTRRGVLFKTVEALESACDVSVVVFDKTGTLTLGKLSVESSKYYPQETVPWLGTERGIQSVVRALTGSSTHPVSAAVHEHVMATLASASPLHTDGLDVKSIPGKGVEATVDGIVIRGGSAVWAAGGGTVKNLGDHTVFVVSVATDPAHSVFTCIAHYTLSDSLRPDALSAIKSLTQRGLEVHILSGDNHGVVTRTASALGIPTTQARGGCSPEEKGQWIKFLQGAESEDCESGCDSEISKRRKVMFVGDGTNDALALVQSDVGVSLGGGTDVASSAAQVVLLSSLNTGLSDVFKLARAARRRVLINFAWAGIYNAAAILLACGALGQARIPPQWAGLGELVSVLPVVLVAWSLGVVNW